MMKENLLVSAIVTHTVDLWAAAKDPWTAVQCASIDLWTLRSSDPNYRNTLFLAHLTLTTQMISFLICVEQKNADKPFQNKWKK